MSTCRTTPRRRAEIARGRLVCALSVLAALLLPTLADTPPDGAGAQDAPLWGLALGKGAAALREAATKAEAPWTIVDDEALQRLVLRCGEANVGAILLDNEGHAVELAIDLGLCPKAEEAAPESATVVGPEGQRLYRLRELPPEGERDSAGNESAFALTGIPLGASLEEARLACERRSLGNPARREECKLQGHKLRFHTVFGQGIATLHVDSDAPPGVVSVLVEGGERRHEFERLYGAPTSIENVGAVVDVLRWDFEDATTVLAHLAPTEESSDALPATALTGTDNATSIIEQLVRLSTLAPDRWSTAPSLAMTLSNIDRKYRVQRDRSVQDDELFAFGGELEADGYFDILPGSRLDDHRYYDTGRCAFGWRTCGPGQEALYPERIENPLALAHLDGEIVRSVEFFYTRQDAEQSELPEEIDTWLDTLSSTEKIGSCTIRHYEESFFDGAPHVSVLTDEAEGILGTGLTPRRLLVVLGENDLAVWRAACADPWSIAGFVLGARRYSHKTPWTPIAGQARRVQGGHGLLQVHAELLSDKSYDYDWSRVYGGLFPSFAPPKKLQGRLLTLELDLDRNRDLDVIRVRLAPGDPAEEGGIDPSLDALIDGPEPLIEAWGQPAAQFERRGQRMTIWLDPQAGRGIAARHGSRIGNPELRLVVRRLSPEAFEEDDPKKLYRMIAGRRSR